MVRGCGVRAGQEGRGDPNIAVVQVVCGMREWGRRGEGGRRGACTEGAFEEDHGVGMGGCCGRAGKGGGVERGRRVPCICPSSLCMHTSHISRYAG